jgi:hypothetical protein
VQLHDSLTVFLNGNGGIDHVVNDTGAAVNNMNQVTNIVSYPRSSQRKQCHVVRPQITDSLAVQLRANL